MRLVEALQHRRHQLLRAREQPRGLPDPPGRDAADLGGPLGRAVGDLPGQRVVAHRVRVHVVAVHGAGLDELMDERVHQRHVGAGQRRQVEGGVRGHRGPSRVHAQDRGWVGTGQPVEDPHPQDALRLGHVVAVQGDHVGVVDVGVRARLPVAAEGGLERRGGGGRAQPRVAVDVVGADPTVGDHAQRVVLLGEQLAAGVEADRAGSLLVQQLPCPADDPVHRGIPVRLDQLAVLPHQRPGQPVRRGVGLPAVEVLNAQATVIDAVAGPPTNPLDAAVDHRHVHRVAVGMQDGGGLDPAVHVLLAHAVRQVGVHADRPVLAGPVGGALAPRLIDPRGPRPAAVGMCRAHPVLPSWWASYLVSPRAAGPSSSSPHAEKRDPCHGQSQDRSASFQLSTAPR